MRVTVSVSTTTDRPLPYVLFSGADVGLLKGVRTVELVAALRDAHARPGVPQHTAP